MAKSLEANKEIAPPRALYIKLGKNGAWEKTCIDENKLMLGFTDTTHAKCLSRNWDEVKNECTKFSRGDGAATRARDQIRDFYEAGEDVLWVTFHANKLWWCFSKPEIRQLEDKTKVRPVIDKWRSDDIHKHTLATNKLSGKLTIMQNFRGTICSVAEFTYLKDKINGIVSNEIKETQETRSKLEKNIEPIIKRLSWKDFELLIDLVFRQAGWQRVGPLGGTQKTFDIDLCSPITDERYCIQVKSRASLDDFNKYARTCCDTQGYSKFYFIVHSPLPDLKIENSGNCELILPCKIAQWVVKYGLVDWVVDKAG